MKSLKRILYISSRGDAGAGGENYLLTLFRNIDRERFEPIVILPADGSLRKPLEDLKIEIFVIEANHGWLKPDVEWYRLAEGLQSRVKAIVNIITSKQIDIVHTNSNHRFEGALAARLTGTPHLYLAHIEYQPDMPLFQRLPFSQASFAQLMSELSDQVVAVSNSVSTTLKSHINDDKLQVIHNGLELNLFNSSLANKSNRLKEELDIPLDSILVTAVGRITPDKGFDYFVDVARLVLQDRNYKVHFLIAGTEENIDFSNSLKQKVADYKIADNFHFLGFRQDIPEILAASDIFVLSSRKEGHPYVMLEAMASKCAVVAFNCAGVEETIEEGISGYIVPAGDIHTLAERLNLLIHSDSLRNSLSDSARKRIDVFFTANKTASELMSVYENLLSRPQKIAGSFGVELFLQNCTELAHLGKMNLQMNDRLRRIEHLVAFIDTNPITQSLRFVRKQLNKLKTS
ncbi:MAG: glycosyltransferase family 4 protein [Methylococcaceae bacterium]|nr:glycosyltransferase family 4 protein [Methylococcaceae bacterium]